MPNTQRGRVAQLQSIALVHDLIMPSLQRLSKTFERLRDRAQLVGLRRGELAELEHMADQQLQSPDDENAAGRQQGQGIRLELHV